MKVLVNPIVSAYRNQAMAQFEGQIASAKTGLGKIVVHSTVLSIKR
jgi:hypothetical protein